MHKKLFLLITIVISITSCSEHDMWLTIVYQSKEKQFEYKAGLSTTLEECIQKGLNSLESNGIKDTGTFECGLNCKSEHPGVFLVCDEVYDYSHEKKG